MKKTFLLLAVLSLNFGFWSVNSSAQSLNFDGSNDYVECGTPLSTVFSGINTITVEAWINTNSGANLQTVTGDYVGPTLQFLLRLDNMKPVFWVSNGSYQNATGATTIPQNTWVHLAGTYDGTTIKIYVNGVLDGSSSFSGNLPTVSSPTRIGASLLSEMFSGSIDEVRIWNIALTQTDVQNNMHCQIAANSTGLVAYYKFNDGIPNGNNATNTTLVDATSNSNNGTLNNFALTGTSSNWVNEVPTLNPATSVVVAANATTVLSGTTDVFTATATNGGVTPTYQWYKNNIAVGTNSNTYSDNTLVTNDTIKCSVTSSISCASVPTAASNKIGITVSANPPAALNFSGATDWVTTNTLLLSGTTNVTMEGWVNWQGGNGNQQIFYNGNSCCTGYGLYTQNGQLNVLYGGVAFNATSVNLPINTWTHLALVNDGTNWIVYMNGVSVYNAPDAPVTPTTITTIGGQSTGENFNGSIDEVRIWNAGRTQAQIQNYMSCSISGAQTNLVANYNFNNGTPNAGNAGVTTITDGSGNANNAALNSFALNGSTSNFVNDVTGLNANASISIATPATSVLSGTTVVFTATAGNGGATPTYQWYKNNIAVGTNSNTYSDNALATNDTIKCSVVSSSPCASVATASSNKIGITVVNGHPAALDFDGANDYVVIPASTGINNHFAANNITVEGWFYPTSSPGGSPVLIGEAYMGDGNVEFSIYQNGTIIYGGFYDGGWEQTSTNITLNTWQHIACTYDQSNINLYINGVLLSSVSNTNPLPLGTEEWRIGRRWDSPEYYQGKMDEIRVWNVARTQTQIQDNMNCSLNGTQANLVANYNFNVGTPNANNAGVTALYDFSANGNNGTLNNFALTGTSSNWVTNVNTLNPAASLSVTATATTIVTGTNVVFTATPANGGGTPSYQWYKNNIAVGTNSNTYSDNTLANNDTIKCSVTSSIPCASVAAATSNKVGISVVSNLLASLNFDGVDDIVSVPSTPTLDNLGSTTITAEAWIYNSNTGVSSIIRKAGDYNLYLNSNVLNAEIWPNGIGDPTWMIITGSTSIQNNTWTHVAFTWNKGTGTAALYVNGVTETITTGNGGVGSSENLYIGASSLYGQYFQGSIDELRIWNIDRTPAQIANNMNCSISAQTNLVASYNFNEGTPNVDNTGVTSLTDGSGNANNGTLTNFTLNGTTSNWVNDANETNLPASVTIIANANSIPAAGHTVVYTATPFNGGIPTYQWVNNGVNISGATASTYTGTVTHSDTISCIMVSSSACATNTPPIKSNKINLPNWGTAALNFDGNNSNYVSIATGTNIPVGNSNYTLEAWIKPNNMDVEGIIGWGNYGSGNQVNALRLDGSGIDNYWWGNDLLISTPDLSGAWHHVAVTYDGTTRKMYLDGDSIGGDAPGVNSVPNTANLAIGVTNFGEYFYGSIDQVRVWNLARTQEQIQDNMNCTLSAQTGLVANYNFNEGIAKANNAGLDSLIDNSGNANLGMLNNFALTDTISNWVNNFTGINPAITVAEGSLINVAFGGTASASDFYGGNPAADAFDGDTITTGWGNNGSLPSWLEYNFGSGNGKVLTGYSFYCSSSMIGGWGGGTYDPTAWTFEGFNGTSWDILESRVDNNPIMDVWKTFYFNNATSYERYRINISNTQDGSYAMITELRLLRSNPANACSNKLFIATTNHNYVSSAYQWQLNGVNIGSNKDSLLLSSFNFHDTLTCILTTTMCATTATVTSNKTVLQQGPSHVNLGSDVTQCGGTLMLNAGNPGASYLWSNAATTQMITATNTGTYSVIVTNASSCSNSDTINVTIHTPPTVNIGGNVTQCGGNVVLNAGNAGATYAWSPAGTTQTITALSSNTYSVVVTDANNCTASDAAVITIHTPPTVSLGGNVTQCGGNVVLNAGNSGATYAWSPAGTTQSISALTSNTYSVVVTDANNCTGSDVAVVTIHTPPTVNLGGNVTQCGGNVVLNAGNSGATYAWSPAGTTQTITALSSNTYSVVVTDANNCTGSDIAAVTINALPGKTTTLNGSVITANQTGASYQWLDCNNNKAPIAGATGQSYTVASTGNFAVEITLNGCSDTSACVSVTATGINAIENSSQLSIYPNPSSGTFTVQSAGEGVYSIMDELGQTVQSLKLNAANRYTFHVEDLSNGIYFIVGYNKEQLTKQKIVITK